MKCFCIVIFIVIYWPLLNAMDNGLHGSLDQDIQMEGRIVNGVEVPITMYPYFALILVNHRVHCGGSVITSRIILTAAHCLFMENEMYPVDLLNVRLGATTINDGTLYNVCKSYSHEKYNGGVLYDVGLILLQKNIKFSYKVQRAKLASMNWRDKARRLTVIGFGLTQMEIKASGKLRMTIMDYVTNRQCDKSQHGFPFDIKVPPNMFCMIGRGWTSDCRGDSGSPVSWRGYVVGIVNSGRDSFCGSDMMPSMYLDVSHFTKWIKNNVVKLSRIKCFFSDKHKNMTTGIKKMKQKNNYPAEMLNVFYYWDYFG